MKLLYSTLALFIAFALPLAVNAATFSFVPSTGSIKPDDTFTVTVYVNPSAGEEITTAKLSTTFPASVVEVISFIQSTGWMALTQPGYDTQDNVNGKLVKTGGFPARVKAPKQFGVITLKAKSVGTATLAVAGDSMLLDSANANKHAGSAGATFTIATPAPTPPPAPKPKPKPVAKPKPKPIPTPVVKKDLVEEATTTDEIANATTSTSTKGENSQLAAAAVTSASKGAGIVDLLQSYWYWLLALLLALAGLFIWRRKENS